MRSFESEIGVPQNGWIPFGFPQATSHRNALDQGQTEVQGNSRAKAQGSQEELATEDQGERGQTNGTKGPALVAACVLPEMPRRKPKSQSPRRRRRLGGVSWVSHVHMILMCLHAETSVRLIICVHVYVYIYIYYIYIHIYIYILYIYIYIHIYIYTYIYTCATIIAFLSKGHCG